MKKLLNYIAIVGVVLFAYSCAEPTTPEPKDVSAGAWDVVDFFVNGQLDDNSNIWERFILERDGSFVLQDQNGIFFGGTWETTDDAINLSVDDGSSLSFAIVYQDYNKMQLVQTISNPTAGDIEIRYLMNRRSNTVY